MNKLDVAFVIVVKGILQMLLRSPNGELYYVNQKEIVLNGPDLGT